MTWHKLKMFEFELEKGSKKFVCPNCNHKTFVFYVSNETGEKLSFDVGRCDRQSNCCYHRTPKQYFADNPQSKIAGIVVNKNGSHPGYQAEILPKKPDYISNNILLRTLTNYSQNTFVQFLLDLFPDDSEKVWQAVKDYLMGTTKTGATIYWQIDQSRKIRTGKIIAYGSDGKRRKSIAPNWIHAALKRSGLLKTDFNLMQCFFGEHLLQIDRQKPVAITEAEKTAVIASICFPEFIWLAIGSKQSLKAEKLKRLSKRKFILYPDGDGFNEWQKAALQARQEGLDVRMSSLIERRGTDAEKDKGFDLADYLTNQQTAINQTNNFIDSYNAKLENVLNDEILMRDVETIIDEHLAVLIVSNELSEMEAESLITNFENLREIVLSV